MKGAGGRTNIIVRVDQDVYRKVIARKAELENERQRSISMNEALRDLLRLEKAS